MNTLSLNKSISYKKKENDLENKTGIIIVHIDHTEDIPKEKMREKLLEMIEEIFSKENKNEIVDDSAVANYCKEKRVLNTDFLRYNHLNGKKLNQYLLRYNYLDLSNSDLETFDFLLEPDINLSTIQTIDVSCDLKQKKEKSKTSDVNRFIIKLFQNCKSLRSLRCIKVENTNLNLDTLLLWKKRAHEDFNGPLIRYYDKMSAQGGGSHVAELEIQKIENTPLMLETNIPQRLEIQRIGETRFETLYGMEGFQKDQVTMSHLQIVLN